MDEYTVERYGPMTAADLRREREGRPVRRHVFHPSRQRSYGVRICEDCGSLETASVHKVRERTDEERDHEKRRTGER